MKRALKVYVLSLGAMGAAVLAQAQSAAFTYNGRLNSNGVAVTGAYDMQFSVYDADVGNGLVAGPLPANGVGVTNGLFTARIDFGAGAFTGPARWLEVSVRPAGVGNFTTLNPRQELTSSPYAIRSQTAGTAGDVANGAVVKSLNGLHDNISLIAGANVTLTPAGNTLTIASAGAGGGGIWSVNNNNAYYLAGNVGIGNDAPNARLYVTSQTASPNDNTATFYGPGLGPNASHVHYGSTGDWYIRSASSSGKVVLQDSGGNVGIGPGNPGSKLTVFTPWLSSGVEHTDGSVRLATYIDATGGWLGTISNHKLHFYVNNSTAKMTMDTAGNVGIGTAFPGYKLDVAGDVAGTRLILRADPLATANAAVLCGDAGVANFVPYNTATARPLNLIVRDATVRVLTITGGADIAEPFKMTPGEITKGSVVVIDEANPGQLKLSTTAYDSRVAGVVSGANGVQPGLRLHQEGVLEGGENVALSGRVYVQADATFGAIKPGDLLTTSDTPGHAMKVTDHAKAQGAILGKAMSGLKDGKGMVLVLVSLQ